jgi:hypothetical protein
MPKIFKFLLLSLWLCAAPFNAHTADKGYTIAVVPKGTTTKF